MRTVVVGYATRQLGIAGIVSAVVVDILGPRVVRHDIQAVGKTPVELRLQRVVVVAGVRPVVPPP